MGIDNLLIISVFLVLHFPILPDGWRNQEMKFDKTTLTVLVLFLVDTCAVILPLLFFLFHAEKKEPKKAALWPIAPRGQRSSTLLRDSSSCVTRRPPGRFFQISRSGIKTEIGKWVFLKVFHNQCFKGRCPHFLFPDFSRSGIEAEKRKTHFCGDAHPTDKDGQALRLYGSRVYDISKTFYRLILP